MANLLNDDRKYINRDNLSADTYYYQPTIASGATNSDGIRIAGGNIIGITFPAGFDGATMTVQTSIDGVTWNDLSGLTVSVVVDDSINIDIGTIQGWMFIRFVSASTESAERTLTVYVKEV